jgi:hypothetical protein
VNTRALSVNFELPREKYRVLEKFEVQVPEAQVALLEGLDGEWGRFQVGLEAAGGRLERHKDAFREQVGGFWFEGVEGCWLHRLSGCSGWLV